MYGAGEVGRDYYVQLTDPTIVNEYGCRIVAWVDMYYEEKKALPIEIIGLQDLRKIDFDYIIISISDRGASASVKKILAGMGIENNKILLEPPVAVIHKGKMTI